MNKVAIITSDQRRHLWACNQIAKDSEIVCIITEAKRPLIDSKSNDSSKLICEYLEKRELSERLWFDTVQSTFQDITPNYLQKEWGYANTNEALNILVNLNPDRIFLFGCSIVKEELLSKFQDCVINMHLGLSPYYRGSATNFWPLADNLPECVGVTIHYAIKNVDAGAIITQVRPDITSLDSPHDIGCKTIIKGVNAIKELVKLISLPNGQDQKVAGILRRRSDFSHDAVARLLRNFEAGMIEKYLDEKEARDATYPIVEYDPNPSILI